MQGSMGMDGDEIDLDEQLQQNAELVPREVGIAYLHDLKVCLRTASSWIFLEPVSSYKQRDLNNYIALHRCWQYNWKHAIHSVSRNSS